MACSPLGTDCFSTVPHGPQFLPESLRPCGLLSAWAAAPARSLRQRGFSTAVDFFRALPPAPEQWGCRVAVCSDVVLHELQGGQPLSPWSPSLAAGESLCWCLEHLLPSFTDLIVCRALISFFLPCKPNTGEKYLWSLEKSLKAKSILHFCWCRVYHLP